jgi:hypothetical protein
VIALVGGEDMVVASELGYLETLIQQALPSHKLKFRSLAWEGDTVFEQRRDLNYPPLEAQLEKVGATVVIAQFGQMESLRGKQKLSEFISAYEKLVVRLKGPGKRRVFLIAPTQMMPTVKSSEFLAVPRHEPDYFLAIEAIATRTGAKSTAGVVNDFFPISFAGSRDGIHLAPKVHGLFASGIAGDLLELQSEIRLDFNSITDAKPAPEMEALRALVVAKNRLWYNYSRPQNWAFLAGDRTNQPSSRDHIDLNKRWFPEELEKFVPLIEAKEKEIWELAAKLKR